MDDANKRLTPHERALVSELPREAAPPPALKGRVTAELRQRGLIRSKKQVTLIKARWLWQAAAVAVAFGVGLAVPRGIFGTNTHPEVENEAPAERVQRTGTLYVEALTALGTHTAPLSEAAREAARNTLLGAAVASARLGSSNTLPPPYVTPTTSDDRTANPIEVWF